MSDLGDFDIAVIGGGINGVGIARDAAGRGLSVLLLEKDDLAQGTSSRSGKLIHGGLRYLEYGEFRLVREALIEREVLLRAARHIIWPLRFVLPHAPGMRPAWLVRLGLFLYDHLGGREQLPATRVLDLGADPEGAALRSEYRTAFEYSDCWVDDARLVVLNALDAAERGGRVLTRTALTSARREGGGWRLEAKDTLSGARCSASARVLVNAAGPWVESVLGMVGANGPGRVRLVKGSHLIVRKFWSGPQAYLLQNEDRRVIFIVPFEGDFALIGTTDIPYAGRPEDVAVGEEEVDYLLAVANRYFRTPLTRADIHASFSGVRPLYDDRAANPSAVTRDYVFDLDAGAGRAPLLSVFGGKITTYRKLAEHALDRLKPHLPSRGAAWTARAPLPGGDLPKGDAKRFLEALGQSRPWLPTAVAADYVRRYGTRVETLLGNAVGMADLGRHFGGTLYEREVRYLIESEWAVTAEDVLERRTKHALHLDRDERLAFEAWMADRRS